MKVYKDIEYDNKSERQKLDLYLPSITEGPYPLLVYIHGGSWQIGEKDDGQEKDWLHLVDNGYALASINYRLNDEVHHPDGLFDCKKALNFLAAHADEYNLDKNRIGVIGTSAGGYYALMLAATNNQPNFAIPNEENADIKCCISWYAPTDFYQGKKNITGSFLNRIKYGVSIAIAENYFGKALKNISKKELLEASPIYYLSKDLPPVLLQQGDQDFVIPIEQVDSFHKAAEKKGASDKVSIEIFNGANHLDPMFTTWDNKMRIKRFLDQNLKNI